MPVPENKLTLKEFDEHLARCMIADRRNLQRRFHRIRSTTPVNPGIINRLQRDLAVSIRRREARQHAIPRIVYPLELPVCRYRQEIIRAISANQVTIICGETGSGKSTQLPKLCLEMGRGIAGWIGHTQPRRLAARTIAARIAEELMVEPGGIIGYRIRHTDRISAQTCIKVMTDGILLAELQSDHLLENYDTLIIDEAHERNLNTDFILGYLKKILPMRPDLKLVITSATIDVERFSEHFDHAPVLDIEGRVYPVEIRYAPPDDDADDLSIEAAILAAIRNECGAGDGDVLVFLEGEREIHEALKFLQQQNLRDTRILPLYSRLATAQQGEIFKPHKQRHIILATNVAETSITIPGIRYVIDTGKARISRYSHRSKVQRLPVEKISQASANQRAGRCGRVANGICIRLYTEDDYLQRAEYTDAEILRTNLAAVILRMKVLKLGRIEHFPFLTPPEARYIKDGMHLLTELGAINRDDHLTETGIRLNQLPVDPRFGRMILAAGDWNCLAEVLIIVSGMCVRDPRERPRDNQQQADEKHLQYADKQSDFLWYTNIWQEIFTPPRRLSNNQLRKFCRMNFLSYLRLREWQDIHRQLVAQVKSMGLVLSESAAGYENIHHALLAGLLGHAATRTGPGEYTGAGGIKLNLFPGSVLFRSDPAWIVAGELLETTRLYARAAARIEPEWLLQPARHLLHYEYFEPRWDQKRGQAVAREKASLYGLVLVPGKVVNYGPIDPDASRKIFIRALAQGDYVSSGRFHEQNARVIASIRTLEHKARRPDILDEQSIFQFYHQVIPAHIRTVSGFEKWRLQVEQQDRGLLCFAPGTVMLHDAAGINASSFPDYMEINGLRLALCYRHDPAAVDDGVTVELPLYLLNQVADDAFDRLVPGLLEEKLESLLKNLPRALRKQLLPLSATIRLCLAEIGSTGGTLTQQLSQLLAQKKQLSISTGVWGLERLPDFLHMNIRVIADDGKVLAQGRNLRAIKADLAGKADKFISRTGSQLLDQEGLHSWTFAQLPETVDIEHNGNSIKAYPALVDRGDAVAIKVFADRNKAAEEMYYGLRRLFMLELSADIRYLRKHMPAFDSIALLYSGIGGIDELQDDIVLACVDRALMFEPLVIRDRDTYLHRKQSGQHQLMQHVNDICKILLEVLQSYRNIRRILAEISNPRIAASVSDIEDQLAELVFPGFLQYLDKERLDCYPRYLQAVMIRLDRIKQNPGKDLKKYREIERLWNQYKAYRYDDNLADIHHELDDFHWLLQELRVSLFAQELKTAEPVSVVKLQHKWNEITADRNWNRTGITA
jgi:ATP-dependent helicase HrpA